ncbi:hypothetical protein P3TCK_20845 [Photobacterium profundum 3TCK]|uniref:Uncharacterized protein n=1 Tax=Photobacterium profundum 3TCK TaxID=314280 RepID=Q1Z8Y7_9GAMM|nr:hypothetical protein P3TCK_20845 [Photobacterium profundum 3TCK]
MVGCYASKMYKKSILLNYCFFNARFFGFINWFNLLFGALFVLLLLTKDVVMIFK